MRVLVLEDVRISIFPAGAEVVPDLGGFFEVDFYHPGFLALVVSADYNDGFGMEAVDFPADLAEFVLDRAVAGLEED